MEKIIEILVLLVAFAITSYLLFYKSWLKELGKKYADLATAQEITELQENVKHDFKVNLEEYKNRLNEELSLKLEPFRSELAKSNIAFQIRYGYLHQERAKVILELYKKLVELHSAMVDWTKFMHPIQEDAEKEETERAIRANKALHDFKNFFLLNKLFFTKDLNRFIEEIFAEYWDKGWDFGYKQKRIRSGNLTKEFYKEYAKDISKIAKELSESIPKKLADLEDIFRNYLDSETDPI
ncbi:hypothetical protein AB3466_14040 [Sphingobacterium thalpophilum]|uniref:hypothetical protein n=1 Tax=Sphingobacterium thalpophilum TaxID=259 RepID=UPI0037DA543B